MGDYTVDYATLMESARFWREENARLTTASARLADASTSGFGSGVSGDVTAFVTTWSTTVSTTASAVEEIAQNVDDAHAAYLGADFEAQLAFEAWLEEAS